MDVQSQNFALITLKERCHFLKQQLKAVDDENIKLKLQIANSNIGKDGQTQSGLLGEVEVLKKQKEQLSNQIHILATENNNMWSRLSRLTVVNRNLTRRFTKISDTLEKYGISNSMSESENDTSVTLDSKDYRKNLEEMSLKLINGIKLEKTDLERQYAQMVDLHKNDNTVTGQELAFASVMDGDEDTVMAGVRKHAQKLNHLKQTLVQQQAMLVAALEQVRSQKNREKNQVNVPKVSTKDVGTVAMEAVCEVVREGVETVRAVPITPTVEIGPSSSHPGGTPADEEQICPMCGAHIPGTAEEFCDHVGEHFEEEIEDNNMVNSFVHLT